MRIEIVAIGDEILNGFTVNTNAGFIAQQLLEAGFSVAMQSVVGDEPRALQEFLTERLQRQGLIITCGGLGPTCDDHTNNVLAAIFDGLQTAVLLENELGTAPGLYLQDPSRFPGAMLIALPGVPSEMKQMFLKAVLPLLKKEYSVGSRLWPRIFHFASLVEEEIDPTLREIQRLFPHVQCSIYPHFSTVTVHLSVMASSLSEAERLLHEAEQLLLSRFGRFLYHSESGCLDEAVHHLLREKKITLATAESCTGGAIAAALVACPDASSYFQGSIVAYANAIKEKVLGVEKQLLETYGAVSEQVTAAMATQVRKLLTAECGIAVSGIFGPAGGSKEKPVGTVCASLSFRDLPVHSWTMQLSGNRHTISEKTMQRIFVELFKMLMVSR